MRLEYDSLGTLEIPDEALYGIHSLRAKKNFIASGEKINKYLIKAILQVKKAAAIVNNKIGILEQEKFFPIIQAIDELLDEVQKDIEQNQESIYEKVIVDPYQGGAGTSLNMNINEVIANLALLKIGRKPGEYNLIHPIDDVNLSQSTNDVIPSAFKIAAIETLRNLANAFQLLQRELQKKEKEFSNIIKLGRTQFQDAAPIFLGQEFGAYAQAIARDRWRLYNAEERLRALNIGGTAIGNSINADKKYVLSIANEIKNLTGLPLAKAEDLIDATQNLDMIVETHGLIKAGAVTIIKICNDLRFLSSGPRGGIGEIILPARQAGSSIMPGKVNPVILENAIQIAELVKSNDVAISNLISQGHLELNAFTPMIAHLYLKSTCLLTEAIHNLANLCVKDIKADKARCEENLIKSSAYALIFINEFGYDKTAELVKKAAENNLSFIDYLLNNNLIDKQKLKDLIKKELGVEIE